MNLYFRLIIRLLCILISTLFDKAYYALLKKKPKKLHFNQPVRSDFYVLPTDLDTNIHMNNGRYLTLMDLGRLDFIHKIGLLKLVNKNRWTPIVGAEQIKFLRPLKLFQKFTIVTKIEYWDEKWFILSQNFESNGKEVAHALVRGVFRKRRINVEPAVVLNALAKKEKYSEALLQEINNPKILNQKYIDWINQLA